MDLLCGSCCFFVSFTCPLCATTDARLRFAVAAHLQGRLHPGRGAVFDPHGSRFPVAGTQGPWSAGRAISTVAVCEETVVLPHLQLVEKIVAIRPRRFPCRDAEGRFPWSSLFGGR